MPPDPVVSRPVPFGVQGFLRALGLWVEEGSLAASQGRACSLPLCVLGRDVC